MDLGHLFYVYKESEPSQRKDSTAVSNPYTCKDQEKFFKGQNNLTICYLLEGLQLGIISVKEGNSDFNFLLKYSNS